MKLSEWLKEDHENGAFGKALIGYSERAKLLEDVVIAMYMDGLLYKDCLSVASKEKLAAAYKDMTKESNVANDDDSAARQNIVGLLPEDLYSKAQNEARINDIIDAMARYRECGKQIPVDWFEELAKRSGFAKNDI